MPITTKKENSESAEETSAAIPEIAGRKKNEGMKRVTEYILEIIKVVLISLAIIVPVRYFLIQPFYVKGASMEPNFFDHEYLIVNEIGYRLGAPERGDIVVFKYPMDTSQYFIKRVIGLPGETVQIKNGKVTIYNKDHSEGMQLDETYLSTGVQTFGDRTVSLGVDEYFLLGDNRLASFDSRSFGPVNKKYIVGRVWLRGWPFDRFKIFGTPNYNF